MARALLIGIVRRFTVRPQLLLVPVIALSLPAAAWDVRTDSEGDVVRWTRTLEMVIDARLTEQLNAPDADQAIRAAIGQLDDATPYLEVKARVGEAKPIGYVLGATDNTNSIVVLEDWPYSEDALAVTLVTLNARTNELLDADVAFNADEHRFKVLPDAARHEGSGFDDVQNTVTHELGHVLGLMHSNKTDDLVMYPSAPPGEILKRVLKQDDRDGLQSLYGEAPAVPVVTPQPPAFGSSSTSSAPTWVFAAPLALLALRRRRLALARAVVPALAFAAAPGQPAVDRAEDVALVQVHTRQVSVHPKYPGLIVTTLTFATQECLKGSCAALDRVVVPGGRLGDLEQFVAHEPVPLEGDQLVVTRTGGKVRVVRVEPAEQIQLLARLRAGSTPTQQGPRPHSEPSQSPAITR